MKDLLRIASLLDYSGNYKLSDKLFKIAERGKLNLPMANREFGRLLNQALVFDGPNKVSIDYDKFTQLIKSNRFLSPFINEVVKDTPGLDRSGAFYSGTKTVFLKQISLPSQIEDVITTFVHEIVHALDPGLPAKQQYETLIRPLYLGGLELSFDDNVKIQAILRTADFLEYTNDDIKKQHMNSYIKYPNALLEGFDEWMKNYPDQMNKNLGIFSKQGLYVNGSFLNKEQYELYKKQYNGKTGLISGDNYFDNRIEPVAWMTQVEKEFSPKKFVRAYSGVKKLNKSMTPEKFISLMKEGLTYNDLSFLRSQVGSQTADYFYENIKDPKIQKQILELIGKNIAKAKILLKGGLVRLSNLELRTLYPAYADYVKNYLKGLPVELQKKFYITQDINGNFKGNFEGIQFAANEYKDDSIFANFDSPLNENQPKLNLPHSDKLTNNLQKTIKYCDDVNCPKNNQIIDKESAKFCKGCGKRLKITNDINNIKSTTTPAKANTTTPETASATQANADPKTTKSPKPPKAPNPTTPRTRKPINSSEIAKKTSSIPQFKGKSSAQSISVLSKVLPTISKIFTELSLKLDKFYNTPAGRVFSKGMLAKDVLAVILLTNNISEQIKNGEQVMLKDQMDLGLTIVSILTDQETHKILEAVYPPIIPFLENPEVKKWMFGINIGANLLSGAITVTDYISTRIYTTNKSEGATSGVQNTPGSLQALVMPVFQLNEKYGEVYNALIDAEKGMPVPQAISKHIMPDASGGIEPYRSSLFYKFRNNKNKIIQYQNSPAFKKLPIQNQLLYPNANSAYAISSYKKARDAQEKARQEAYNRNFGPGSGGL